MDSINVIEKYFPGLSGKQREQFEKLGPLYADWNSKINVISRKDIDNLYTNHILHSLAIAKFLQPAPGTTFLDMGTGGGFPGIPLAIMYPECRFSDELRAARADELVDELRNYFDEEYFATKKLVYVAMC